MLILGCLRLLRICCENAAIYAPRHRWKSLIRTSPCRICHRQASLPLILASWSASASVASQSPAHHWAPLMLLQAPHDWKPYHFDISLQSVYIYRTYDRTSCTWKHMNKLRSKVWRYVGEGYTWLKGEGLIELWCHVWVLLECLSPSTWCKCHMQKQETAHHCLSPLHSANPFRALLLWFEGISAGSSVAGPWTLVLTLQPCNSATSSKENITNRILK